MKVFCCHSASDKDMVKPIALALRSKGHDVFLDEWSLSPGDSLIERIPEAISQSGVFTLFLSKASKDSPWCNRELAIAVFQMLKSGRVRVFAYRLERIDPPLIIDDMVFIDAVKFGYDEALSRLELAIEGKAARAVAQAYEDIVVEPLVVRLQSDEPPPAGHHAGIRIRARRFAHPRLYVRITATAPISTRIHQSVEGYDGLRSMIASAVHGHVLEHTQGPPGLEPGYPWVFVVFSDQPVAIQDVQVEESNPFNEVDSRRAASAEWLLR